MKFILTVDRKLRTPTSEVHRDTHIELKRVEFEANSVTAAKRKATQIANETPLFENKIKWDSDEPQALLGKEVRWKPWDTRETYIQESNGVVVGWSGKLSESYSGDYDDTIKMGRSYQSWLTLYWPTGDMHAKATHSPTSDHRTGQ